MPEIRSRGAAAVIFDGAGHVLLVKENCDRRRWSLPGGAVEPGESDEEAVIREVSEETGVVARVDDLISYGLDNGFTVVAFVCSIVDGNPAVPPTGEIAEVTWSSVRQLPSPRSNILHYAVPDAVAGVRDVRRVELPRISWSTARSRGRPAR
jgi:8-oxo-dGTP pyrophosphatase MutT (NUDIX family)